MDYENVSFDFSTVKDRLESVKEQVRDAAKLDAELNALIRLKDSYKDIMKKESGKARVDAAVEALLEVSAHEERLADMRQVQSKYLNICINSKSKAMKTIQKSGELNQFKTKTDRQEFCDFHLSWADTVIRNVETNIERIDKVLEYVRNTSFTLKSIISALKANYSDEQ